MSPKAEGAPSRCSIHLWPFTTRISPDDTRGPVALCGTRGFAFLLCWFYSWSLFLSWGQPCPRVNVENWIFVLVVKTLTVLNHQSGEGAMKASLSCAISGLGSSCRVSGIRSLFLLSELHSSCCVTLQLPLHSPSEIQRSWGTETFLPCFFTLTPLHKERKLLLCETLCWKPTCCLLSLSGEHNANTPHANLHHCHSNTHFTCWDRFIYGDMGTTPKIFFFKMWQHFLKKENFLGGYLVMQHVMQPYISKTCDMFHPLSFYFLSVLCSTSLWVLSGY